MDKLRIVLCNKNCDKCRNLSGSVDGKGIPYVYECMKYKDTVFKEQFNSTKAFRVQGGD